MILLFVWDFNLLLHIDLLSDLEFSMLRLEILELWFEFLIPVLEYCFTTALIIDFCFGIIIYYLFASSGPLQVPDP